MATTKRTTRSMYCITGPGGQYLIDLSSDGPVFSHLPAEALQTKHAWLNSCVAVEAWRKVSDNFPGITFGLAVLELIGTGPGCWQVATTRGFSPSTSRTPLIG